MSRFPVLIALIALVFSVTSISMTRSYQASHDNDWVSMFNGHSLEGWTQKNGWASYRVESETIIGTTAISSPNSFLCTLAEYGDFELEFEVKCANQLNSGVQIRSRTADQPAQNVPFEHGRVNGPQVEIEASGSEGAEAGYIYGEATGRGWLVAEKDLLPHKTFKDDEWNHYRIVARGPRIQTFINGDPICDLTDEAIFKTHARGFIGLQVHGVGDQGPFEVSWRQLRIRELD